MSDELPTRSTDARLPVSRKRRRRRLLWLPLIVVVLCGYCWWAAPRSLRFVGESQLPIHTNMSAPLSVGEAGLMSIEGPKPEWSTRATALVEHGWDGQERWRVQLPAITPENNDTDWWGRQVACSTDLHVMAEMTGYRGVCVRTWRDGRLAGSVTIPATAGGLLQPDDIPSIAATNDGRVVLAYLHPDHRLCLIAVNGRRIIATGSADLQPDAATIGSLLVAPDGKEAVFSYPFGADESGLANYGCASLAINGSSITLSPLHNAPMAPDLLPHRKEIRPGRHRYGWYSREQAVSTSNWHSITATTGSAMLQKQSPPVANDMDDEDKADVGCSLRVSDLTTMTTWQPAYHGSVRAANITPDGRFVVILGKRDPPLQCNPTLKIFGYPLGQRIMEMQTPSPALYIYERPGKLRARLFLTTRHGDDTIISHGSQLWDDHSTQCFISSDGRRGVLVSGKRVVAFKW